MKIRSIDLDEETGEPDRFVCVLSRAEMALLYRLVGHLSPADVDEALAPGWGDALLDLAEGSGNVFNQFYEDGVNDVIPRWQHGISVQ